MLKIEGVAFLPSTMVLDLNFFLSLAASVPLLLSPASSPLSFSPSLDNETPR